MLLSRSLKLVPIAFMQHFPSSNHSQHRTLSRFTIAKNPIKAVLPGGSEKLQIVKAPDYCADQMVVGAATWMMFITHKLQNN